MQAKIHFVNGGTKQSCDARSCVEWTAVPPSAEWKATVYMNTPTAKKTFVAVSTATMLATAGLVGGFASPAQAATCPDNGWWNITQALVHDNFDGTGVNIRSGPSTSCTVLGQGNPAHNTVIHCYKTNPSSGHRWTHVYLPATGVTGWVRNDYLHIASPHHC